MTHQEIEQMPAGRELDGIVAQKIFCSQIYKGYYPEDHMERREDRPWEQMPYYSDDIAAAMQAAEKYQAKGYTIQLHLMPNGKACATVIAPPKDDKDWPPRYEAAADTLAHAICLALLATLTV